MLEKIACLLLGVILALGLSSCQSVTKQRGKTTVLDVSQEDTLGGTGTSATDVRAMGECVDLVNANIDWLKGSGKIRIALTEIQNETGIPTHFKIIKERLLADLVNLSPAGSRVQYTENPQGANYELNTIVTALTKGSSEGI